MLDQSNDFNPETPAPESPEGPESSNRTFYIIGGILGGIVLLTLACFVFIVVVYLPNQNKQKAAAQAVTQTLQAAHIEAFTQTAQATLWTQNSAAQPAAFGYGYLNSGYSHIQPNSRRRPAVRHTGHRRPGHDLHRGGPANHGGCQPDHHGHATGNSPRENRVCGSVRFARADHPGAGIRGSDLAGPPLAKESSRIRSNKTGSLLLFEDICGNPWMRVPAFLFAGRPFLISRPIDTNNDESGWAQSLKHSQPSTPETSRG